MTRYNEKKNCFETVNHDEPIRIEFAMEDTFEFKQSDFDEDKIKNKKEALVESAMDAVDEILSGKHFRAIRDSIEQQIRRAYKQGYCDGIDDAPGEDDAYEKGFRDGVTYCKNEVLQISSDKGLEMMKTEEY